MRTAIDHSLKNNALGEILGQEFVEFYCRHRSAETTKFENHIAEREYDWYL